MFNWLKKLFKKEKKITFTGIPEHAVIQITISASGGGSGGSGNSGSFGKNEIVTNAGGKAAGIGGGKNAREDMENA